MNWTKERVDPAENGNSIRITLYEIPNPVNGKTDYWFFYKYQHTSLNADSSFISPAFGKKIVLVQTQFNLPGKPAFADDVDHSEMLIRDNKKFCMHGMARLKNNDAANLPATAKVGVPFDVEAIFAFADPSGGINPFASLVPTPANYPYGLSFTTVKGEFPSNYVGPGIYSYSMTFIKNNVTYSGFGFKNFTGGATILDGTGNPRPAMTIPDAEYDSTTIVWSTP